MSLVIVYRNVHKSTIRNNWCVWCIKYWLFGDKQVEYCSYSSSPNTINITVENRAFIHPLAVSWIWVSKWAKPNCKIIPFLCADCCACASGVEAQLKYLLLRWNIGFRRQLLLVLRRNAYCVLHAPICIHFKNGTAKSVFAGNVIT